MKATPEGLFRFLPYVERREVESRVEVSLAAMADAITVVREEMYQLEEFLDNLFHGTGGERI